MKKDVDMHPVISSELFENSWNIGNLVAKGRGEENWIFLFQNAKYDFYK